MKTLVLDKLAPLGSTAVAVGSFDGVHLGHREILRTLVDHARSLRVPAAVLTFENHPRTIARREEVPLIMCPGQQAEILAELGVDYRVVAGGDDFFNLSPDDFVEGTLARLLGAREVVVGFNFRFGRKRSGTPEGMAERGESLGFRVTVIPPARLDGRVISSSAIRARLAAGDVETAARMLGRPYEVRGLVVPGDGRGTRLGFPTSNLASELPVILPYAVYRVRVSGTGCPGAFPGPERDALASWGVRPTFGAGREPVLEIHVPGFSGRTDGCRLKARFLSRIRPEMKFKSEAELVEAMKKDLREAFAR